MRELPGQLTTVPRQDFFESGNKSALCPIEQPKAWFCHKEIIELGAIDRPVISKTECLKIVRWSIRNATLCVEQAVRAQDSHAKEWFAKGAIYWRDVAAYWLEVCEMHQARESSA
jgi:hypothetical protein